MVSKRKRRTDSEAPVQGAPKAPFVTRRTAAFSAGALLVVGLVIAGFAVPGKSAEGLTASAKPDHGKVLYRQYCAACHGSEGQGEFQWQYRERGTPALDSTGHAWHHEDAQLLSMILDKPVPDSKMPPWRGVLSRDDALDIIAYIKTLWTSYILANCQGAKHMQCMAHR